MHKHYCMGKLVGSGYYHSTQKPCEKCGMEKSAANGCCTDEHQFLKLNREHSQAKAILQLIVFDTPVVSTSFAYNHPFTHPATKLVYSYLSPPYKQGQRLYIFYCSYRI